MSRYKSVRENEEQVLLESYKNAGQFKRLLNSYLEPNSLFGERLKCYNNHILLIEGFSIEEVEAALAFYRGAGYGSYLIEWGSFE